MCPCLTCDSIAASHVTALLPLKIHLSLLGACLLHHRALHLQPLYFFCGACTSAQCGSIHTVRLYMTMRVVCCTRQAEQRKCDSSFSN